MTLPTLDSKIFSVYSKGIPQIKAFHIVNNNTQYINLNTRNINTVWNTSCMYVILINLMDKKWDIQKQKNIFGNIVRNMFLLVTVFVSAAVNAVVKSTEDWSRSMFEIFRFTTYVADGCWNFFALQYYQIGTDKEIINDITKFFKNSLLTVQTQ